jgi:hypothetical protein
MMERGVDMCVLEWAKKQASLLLPPLGDRWLHVQGVVERAQWVSQVLNTDEDRLYLVAAAYLHDIGYAPALKCTGLHPLDGAWYIHSALGNERLASLVAHHSEARFEAQLRGYAPDLKVFPREQSAVADALMYCDITTDATGKRVSLKQRIADIVRRYGETDVVIQALQQARPYWSLAIARTQSRLYKQGLLCDRTPQEAGLAEKF